MYTLSPPHPWFQFGRVYACAATSTKWTNTRLIKLAPHQTKLHCTPVPVCRQRLTMGANKKQSHWVHGIRACEHFQNVTPPIQTTKQKKSILTANEWDHTRFMMTSLLIAFNCVVLDPFPWEMGCICSDRICESFVFCLLTRVFYCSSLTSAGFACPPSIRVLSL